MMPTTGVPPLRSILAISIPVTTVSGRFEWSRRDVVDPAGDVDQCVIAQPGHVDGDVMDPGAGRDEGELLDGVDVDQIVQPGDQELTMIGRERELLADAGQVDEERIGNHRAFQGIGRVDAERRVGAEGEGAGAAFRRQFRDAAILLRRIRPLVAVRTTLSRPVSRREEIGSQVEGQLSGDGRAERAFRGEGSGGERLRCAHSPQSGRPAGTGRPSGGGSGSRVFHVFWVVAKTNELRRGYTRGGPSVPLVGGWREEEAIDVRFRDGQIPQPNGSATFRGNAESKCLSFQP